MPGVRVNLTHRGAGVRVGPKGLGITANTRGRKSISAGIPGTGIHMSETISNGRRTKQEAEEPPQDQRPSTASEKFFMTVGILAIIGGFVWLVSLLV